MGWLSPWGLGHATLPLPPMPLSHPSRCRSVLIFLRKPFKMTVIKV